MESIGTKKILYANVNGEELNVHIKTDEQIIACCGYYEDMKPVLWKSVL